MRGQKQSTTGLRTHLFRCLGLPMESLYDHQDDGYVEPKGETGKSFVWKHFVIVEDDISKAKCLRCCEEISRGKSPSLFSMSPLIRHLRKCSEQEHSIVASRGRKKPPSTSATKQSGPTKSKTKSALKITASNVWKH